MIHWWNHGSAWLVGFEGSFRSNLNPQASVTCLTQMMFMYLRIAWQLWKFGKCYTKTVGEGIGSKFHGISYRKFLPVISVRNPLSHCGINDWPSVSLFHPTLPVWLCWGINIFIFLLCAQGMSITSPKWMTIKKLIPLISHTSNLLSPITRRLGGIRMMLSLHRSLVYTVNHPLV